MLEDIKLKDIPYSYRKAKFQSPRLRGYWVTLYILVDEDVHAHVFYDSGSLIDNMQLLQELDISYYNFTKEILVTSDCFSHIFQSIDNYVSASDNY